ncbi:membrane protease YdiL (CAAX protease family) [Natranaerovirga hydrolytica]|uniref:Membrane protease YdiL (CAAX protease family) n=1 Tax=Natranaerovirga hydrolytica TaxID=680378 RepID=A0A4R1M887_9FIRM|nr:type II CAAX endopeptidase family protein [Natranaerovirga hydrolytica]TCK88007.1 membrane protease YdiL (CAAX protease family) [Natranaerovirga hydrolytica]
MKNFLKAVGFLLLIGVIYLVTSFLVGIILGVIAAVKGISSLDDIMFFINSHTVNLVMLVNLMMLFFIWLLFLMRKEKSLIKYIRVKSLNPENIFSFTIMAIVLNVCISAAVMSLEKVIDIEHFIVEHDNAIEAVASGNVFMTLLLVVFIAPLFEEVLCRGVILNDFRKSSHLMIAIIIQSIVFGVMHGNLIQGTYAFVIGIVFALYYLKHKNILVPIYLHMIFNLMGLLLGIRVLSEIMVRYSVIITIISLGILMACLYNDFKDGKSLKDYNHAFDKDNYEEVS